MQLSSCRCRLRLGPVALVAPRPPLYGAAPCSCTSVGRIHARKPVVKDTFYRKTNVFFPDGAAAITQP